MMQLFDFHHHQKNKISGIYNLGLFEDEPSHYFSVGIHPKDILQNNEAAMIWMKEKSMLDHCLAIGECGLDSLISIPPEDQETYLQQQIIWANEIRKPLIIHCVRRFSEMIRFRKEAKVPMIIHGFNKKQSIADSMQNNGFYLSFGKSLLENLSLQSVFKNYPIDRIFLETDDVDFEIEKLYEKAADIKQITTSQLMQQTDNNLKDILNI